MYWNVEFLLEFITLNLGRLDCIWGCKNKFFYAVNNPLMLVLHGKTMLDWLQPLKEVLNPPEYEGRIHALLMWQHNAVRYGRINTYKWPR